MTMEISRIPISNARHLVWRRDGQGLIVRPKGYGSGRATSTLNMVVVSGQEMERRGKKPKKKKKKMENNEKGKEKQERRGWVIRT